MGKSKIIFGNETLIDLTGDTVTAADLVRGVTAHDKSGNLITGTYDKPSGSTTITSNGTHDVTSYASAVVNVPVPSGYINISDTLFYCTQGAAGSYTTSSDTLISNVSITVGFKPKVFIIRIYTGTSSQSTSKYYILNSWVIRDNNGENILHTINGDSVNSRHTAGVYYGSSQGARTAQSMSSNNCFEPTSNGVAGNGSSSSTFYFKSGVTYYWFAWG